MAVVTKYAASYKDPSLVLSVPPVFAEGQLRVINTKAVAIANGDSATSKIYLGKIPSSAIPCLLSTLYHDAITGVTSLDIGLEYNGAIVSANALASALNVSAAAGSKSVFAAVTTANTGKRLWELLGLSTDPGREYAVVATLNAAATAAGNFAAQIIYSK